jgi:EmrB/QacA subfamily drug resistance transporter
MGVLLLSTTTQAVSADPGLLPARRQALPLAVLAGALGLDVSGVAVLNAALPRIGTYYQLDSSTLQWTMTSYAVAFAGFLLLGGRAADVLGRRLIFSLGVGIFTVAALAGALAPNVSLLILARAAQGVGAALSGPAALALLTSIFAEGPARNRAFSIYAAVGAASFSGGVVLGGMLTGLFGWRSVLAFSALFGAVVLAGVRRGLPRGIRHRHPLDLPGAALVTAGLLLVVFGVSRGGGAGWTDGAVLTSLAVAVVLLVAFAGWERRAPEPLLPLTIFQSVPVRVASFTAVTYYTAAFALLFFAPLYMQRVLGYSPYLSGLAVLPSSVVLFLTANFLTGRLMGRLGIRPPMVLGLGLIAVSMLLWVFTPTHGNYLLYLLPSFVITGIGQGLTFPTMTVAALTGVPQRQHGVAGAVNVTAQQVGASIGVAALVVVAVAGTTGPGAAGQLAGYHAAFYAATALCVVGMLVAAAVRRGWHGGTAAESAVGPAVEAEPAVPAAAPAGGSGGS